MIFLPIAFLVLGAQAQRPEPPHWIWSDGIVPKAQVWFRRDFQLNEIPTQAILHITCDDEYVLYVNGHRLAANANWYTMQDVSLLGSLKKGKNVIAVAGTNLKASAGLLVDCSLPLPDGKSLRLSSDTQWKVVTQLLPGWNQIQFDDSKWIKPSDEGKLGILPWGYPADDRNILLSLKNTPEVHPESIKPPIADSPDPAEGYTWPKNETGPKGHFQQMTIQPVYPPRSELVGKVITKQTTIKVDFGRELAGWVVCKVKSERGLMLTIRVGEASTPQPEYTTVARRKGDITTFTLEQPNDYTGFRYAWITFDFISTPTTIESISAHYRLFPANYIGSFQCSDPLLNKIWQIGAYTVRLNLDPIATGSILRPDRGDRYPWMGDDRVSHHTMFDVFGDYGLARNDFNYFVKPGAKNISINGIPGYTLDWVIAMADYYRYSGDLSIAREHSQDIASILRDLDTTGTPPGWLFTDWEPGLNVTSPESVLAFHVKYLQAAEAGIWLEKAMGNKTDAADFAKRRDEMLAYLKQNKDWPNRLPRHALTDAILAGYANQYPKSMLSSTATPYFTYYCVQALSDVGQNQRALDTIRNTWGQMVKLGATTTWEFFQTPWGKVYTDDPQPPELTSMINDTISLCHPWSSGATAWMSDHILGVTPLSPGFNSCLVKPFFGDLRYARGSLPTPKGLIHVAWKKVGSKYIVRVSTPRRVALNLSLSSEFRWKINGKLYPKGVHDWTFPASKKPFDISVKSL